MSREKRNKVLEIICLISEFVLKYGKLTNQTYLYIKRHNILENLNKNYNMKQRIEFIDLAKGICMSLVVYSHVYLGDHPKLGEFQDYISLPLFFSLSGLLFKTYNDYMDFCINKINKLIIEKNELQNKIVYLNKTIAEKENYEHALKSKYGKKVNILQLQKEELNHRLSNLMDNLLALKEYANQIERSIRNKNINDAYVSSSLKKEDVMDTNRDEYNLQLINTLKGIINKIDTKILVTSTTDEENEDNEMISN